MTKKKRRSKAKYSSRPQRPAHERQGQQPAGAPSGRQQPARASYMAQNSAARYQHVIPELKRIGLIGGVMILALIILSFAPI